MLQRNLFVPLAMALAGGMRPGFAAKADDFQQGVAHDAVLAMNPATHFTHTVEARHRGTAIFVDHYPAVLVVQGGVDKQRRLAWIDASFSAQVEQLGKALLQNPWIAQLQPRRIQPNST